MKWRWAFWPDRKPQGDRDVLIHDALVVCGVLRPGQALPSDEIELCRRFYDRTLPESVYHLAVVLMGLFPKGSYHGNMNGPLS